MANLVVEQVFLERDNAPSIAIYLDGDTGLIPVDFSAITRMALRFMSADITIDTDDHADSIDWSKGDGEIVFNIGTISGLSLQAGDDIMELVAYDPIHPNGQVICHESTLYQLVLEVVA